METKFKFEIIVLLSACIDNSFKVALEASSDNYLIKYKKYEDDEGGLSRAKNIGIANIDKESQYIAFIDDDGQANQLWLQRFIDVFEYLGNNVVKIVGDIEPIYEADPPEWLTTYMKMMISAEMGLNKETQYINTPSCEGNSCYRRSLFEKFGMFPEQLGRKGDSLISGENNFDWNFLVHGLKTYYEPSIIMKHFIPAEKLTQKWIRRRFFWQGVSDYIAMQYILDIGLKYNAPIIPLLPNESEVKRLLSGGEFNDGLLEKLRWLGFTLKMAGVV